MERDPVTGASSGLTYAEESQSAVSWPAILAGAATTLGATFVFMALIAGFGLKATLPMPGAAASDNFTPMAGAILVAAQVLSAALGGYLAGRLRTKWTHLHSHETHFRDTAHGLIVWAVATVAGGLLTITVLAPAAGRAAAAAMVATAATDPASLQAAADHAQNLAAQAALFSGVGLLLSAFTACVAAALGGLRRDEMHVAYWSEHARLR